MMFDLKWWQKAVFYQIYPRSFADANSDGIGDLEGIIQRLDYLQDLGVDALWLSPHYPSPLVDCGYDVADYTAVAPEYGDLATFQRFVDEAHRREMRVILDLVLNHTSDQHPWFIESRSGRDNPRRDWYIWRDGRAGGPPNNWYSTFGGPAWSYDPHTGQYYYHFFFREQPDLNWRNPAVKQAMFQAMRFWLDRGVDGFRLDAVGTIFEEPGWPDHPATITQAELGRLWRDATTEAERKIAQAEWETMFKHQVEQPGIHELMQELRALVDAYGDRVLVGESEQIAYHGDGDNELHLVFNFPLMNSARLTPAAIRANQQARLAELPPAAWPCNTLGNHDSSRMYNRYGDGRHDAALARLHLALLLTLRGTPFLYNGEEIGMTDLYLTDRSHFRDSVAHWTYEAAVGEWGMTAAEALALAAEASRDRCRTPMQWANAPNAGFSPAGVTTWLPVNPNYAQGVNVAEQAADPDSLLNTYRRLLRLRQETPALVTGDYTPLCEEAEEYLIYLRHSPADNQTCLVALNFSDRRQEVTLDLGGRRLRPLFASHAHTQGEEGAVRLPLAPFAVYVGEVGQD
ncbi:MAG: alpha-glucosidase [Chloroflexota bacterium]